MLDHTEYITLKCEMYRASNADGGPHSLDAASDDDEDVT
jgi:hypothetical protein